jgi:hypothetical protein
MIFTFLEAEASMVPCYVEMVRVFNVMQELDAGKLLFCLSGLVKVAR